MHTVYKVKDFKRRVSNSCVMSFVWCRLYECTTLSSRTIRLLNLSDYRRLFSVMLKRLWLILFISVQRNPAGTRLKCLTLYGHIETGEQRTIIQQYSDWYTGHWYGWYSEEGLGRAAAPSNPLMHVPIKCNSRPINGQCTNFISFDVAL